MSWLPVTLILIYFVYLFGDFAFTKVTPDEPDQIEDPSEDFYNH